MSGTGLGPLLTVATGYEGYRAWAPLTAVQRQELEHQAMIYKYLVAGLPVPSDLVMPIRHSFEAISTRLAHHPSLGYNSFYGKKFDPEPGRCRRTDGKKWRCSKEAHTDSKYCERHMHHGRNRSRKPVETKATSKSLSTDTSTQCNGSFQHMPLYAAVGSQGSSSGNKLQTPPNSYGIHSKDSRYIHGPTTETRELNFSLDASASQGLGSSAGNTWRSMPPQMSLFGQKYDSLSLGNSSAEFESTNLSKQQQRHCFFESNDMNSPGAVKQEQQPVHLFFSEWPTTKEDSWSNLDDHHHDDGNIFSSQLSISIPNTSYATNDA